MERNSNLTLVRAGREESLCDSGWNRESMCCFNCCHL